MSVTGAQKKIESKALANKAKAEPVSIATEAITPINAQSIQRKADCACGGSCPRCQAQAPGIQPKLSISEPGDPYEQEADRVADQVMRMPDQQIQRQERNEEDDDTLIQQKSAGDVAPGVSASTAAVIQSLKGGGHPLPKSTRGFFESRIGADFSSVRVHNDTHAADATKSVKARAFTLGNDVVFGAGEYAPDTLPGKKLLAHELTHVVQQGAASRYLQRQCLSGSVCGEPDESEEPEAEGGEATSAEEETPTPTATETVRPVTRPIPGSPGAFGDEASEAREAERERRTREEPESTGQGRRATFIESYARDQGISLAPIHGIYIDQTIIVAGGYHWRCGNFRHFSEPFTGDRNASCLFFPESRESEAQQFLENPDAENIGDASRESWRLWMNEMLVHELQHAVFRASTRPDSPEGRCSLRTIVYSGRRVYSVEHFLSELSSILSEFTVRYRENPPHSLEGMNWWFNNRVTRGGESIGGILTNLRCVCDCSEVDEYVRQTEEFTADPWSDIERAYLNAALQRQPNLDWPVTPIAASLTELREVLEARQPGRRHTWSITPPPTSFTAGYARYGETDSFLGRAGVDFGIPLDELRRWAISVGLSETFLLSNDYQSFLTGVRAGMSMTFPGGTSHSFRVGAFGEFGGAASRSLEPGASDEFTPDIYSQAGLTLGYTSPADETARLNLGVDILGGTTFGVGGATARPWFGVGLRFGLEFFAGSE